MSKRSNTIKAKQEHKNRLNNVMYILQFNEAVDKIKRINKLDLLFDLIEVTDTDPYNFDEVLALEELIELRKKQGIIDEFYNEPEEME